MSTCSKKKAILKKEVVKKQDGKGGPAGRRTLEDTSPDLEANSWRPQIDDSSTKELIRNTEKRRAEKKAPLLNGTLPPHKQLIGRMPAVSGSGPEALRAMKLGMTPNLRPGSMAGKTLDKFTVPAGFKTQPYMAPLGKVFDVGANVVAGVDKRKDAIKNALKTALSGGKARRVTRNSDFSPQIRKEKG